MSESQTFFAAAAGLLPTLFIAVMVQREAANLKDETPPRSGEETPPRSGDTWKVVLFSVVIFVMCAGELAAFHALRTNHASEKDYWFVAAAAFLLVFTILVRVIGESTTLVRVIGESTILVRVIGERAKRWVPELAAGVILGALSLVWFFVL